MFGQRLRLARKKAGMTLQGLAAEVSPPVSAQAISKYEAGKMMPSSSVLVGLGKVLNVSLDFLMGAQVAELQGVEFRKHSGTSAQDRARAEAIVTEMVEDYLAIEDILDLDPAPDAFRDVRTDVIASLDEAEGKAAALRVAWNLGNDPIPSMTRLLEERGIKVIEADLPERFDGLACSVRRADGRPDVDVIVVSSRTNVERKRFNLAHELAHRVIRSVSDPNLRLEAAMNRFAAAFLVPADHLREEVGGPRHAVIWHELVRLKQFYGISAAAMLIRFRDAVGLPDSVVQYAFRTYARGWRTGEPEPIRDGEGFAAFEKPVRFENLVYRALAEELISPARASQLLKRPLTFIEEQIRGPRPS